MCLDTPLHGNNARGAKYAVYYASVATHTVFENIKWLRSELCRIRNAAVPSLACLFPEADRIQALLKYTSIPLGSDAALLCNKPTRQHRSVLIMELQAARR